MKTYKNLYPQICIFESLFLAYGAAARGKRGKPGVAAFECELEPNLFRLQEELVAQTYQPGPYTHFRIRDPKHRLISAAPFCDRVVHHALVRVIEPILDRGFIYHSYANRVGKGTHRALDRCQELARRYPYVLQCDLRQFFPSVDHAILRRVLARRIGDADVLWLIDGIMAGGAGVLDDEYQMVWFPGDDLLAAERLRGLPIGNLTSQFWANVYLDPLDHYIKRQLECRGYVRYVDDFLLFSDSKDRLWGWKVKVRAFLATYRLALHERSSTVYPVGTGIPFLGFRSYPQHRRLKRRNGIAFARRLRRAYAAKVGGDLDDEALRRIVQGWVAHAKHGDTYGLRKALLSAQPVPRTGP